MCTTQELINNKLIDACKSRDNHNVSLYISLGANAEANDYTKEYVDLYNITTQSRGVENLLNRGALNEYILIDGLQIEGRYLMNVSYTNIFQDNGQFEAIFTDMPSKLYIHKRVPFLALEKKSDDTYIVYDIMIDNVLWEHYYNELINCYNYF